MGGVGGRGGGGEEYLCCYSLTCHDELEEAKKGGGPWEGKWGEGYIPEVLLPHEVEEAKQGRGWGMRGRGRGI